MHGGWCTLPIPWGGRGAGQVPSRQATFAAPGPQKGCPELIPSAHQAESANWARRRTSPGSQNPRGPRGVARGEMWTPGAEQGLGMCQRMRQATEGVCFTCPLGSLCASLPLGPAASRKVWEHPESSASKLAGHRPERGCTAWGQGVSTMCQVTLGHPGKLKQKPLNIAEARSFSTEGTAWAKKSSG